jgi:hypothetical protein
VRAIVSLAVVTVTVTVGIRGVPTEVSSWARLRLVTMAIARCLEISAWTRSAPRTRSLLASFPSTSLPFFAFPCFIFPFLFLFSAWLAQRDMAQTGSRFIDGERFCARSSWTLVIGCGGTDGEVNQVLIACPFLIDQVIEQKKFLVEKC